MGGYVLLSQHGFSLPHCLTRLYPEGNWDVYTIKAKSLFYKRSQHLLKTMLKTIFPQEGGKILGKGG